MKSKNEPIARFPDDRMALIILSNQQNYDESIYRLLVGELLSQDLVPEFLESTWLENVKKVER